MSELYHHGIKGQKWGVRRYQNPDGTYTAEGRKRYGMDATDPKTRAKGQQKYLNELQETIAYDTTKSKHYKENSEFSAELAADYTRRAAKKEQKGKDPTKYRESAERYTKLSEEHKKTQQDYEKLIELAKAETDRAVAALTSEGYSVTSKATTYATHKINSLMYKDVDFAGANHVGGLGGVYGGALGGAVSGGLDAAIAVKNGVKPRTSWKDTYSRESGQKYKVSQDQSNDEKYKKRVKHSDEGENTICTNWTKTSENSLTHFQVKGAKHGLRRYQNPDGSLTPLGRIHYGVGDPRARRKQEKEYRRSEKASEKAARQERVKLAKESVAAGKARKKWEKMSDEDKLKVYDKNMKKSRDWRYEQEQEAKAKEEAEKAKTQEAKENSDKKDESEQTLSKREQRKEEKKAAEREEQIKKDTEKINEALRKNQNEPEKKERKAVSAADYQDVSSALKKTSENIGSMKDLVNVIEGARQRNAVRNAVGERKLTKPINEMSDKEINDTVNRWAAEERIASASVGARSAGADRVTTALDIVGNLTLQTSRAFGIASNIRSIVER